MYTVSAEETAAALPFGALIPALREGLARGATTPPRHHHQIDKTAGSTLLLMPSWRSGGLLGVKLVNVFPENSARGRPALSSAYVLASANTGEHLGVIDGNELTRRRTVATAALASSYLARPDSRVHLVVGAGHIGSLAAEAHATVLGIRTVLVHDQRREAAAALVTRLRESDVDAHVADDLDTAIPRADVISCATLATSPIIRGELLTPGTHLDLVGSFRQDMREADDTCLTRGTLYIDSEIALDESGDLTQPLLDGIITRDAVAATLPQLCRREALGRRDDHQITVFKAVGTALADLAAAALVHRSRVQPAGQPPGSSA
ncbi:ornithine cyclodeaminase family protein [Amycolatopsis sp. BJA-103]|uniref:ornithine cyclodeaminase family protein n=1 Tax=unclassified Amycolatopsis TaxID=2618356 RepID=UPI000C78FA27|nr:ornithine cyclodeaminase family protein [Amycolatopsis sp. BJA-103]AUI61181.1 ornithine cyclodeaminase [Amycolatopsis sp. BJA-103]PNE21530.1 ornithine cyclodeaminase [Amycolatopsis sp. BJA-103]